MRFQVIYLTGGRDAETIEADSYVDDGRFYVFRKEEDGTQKDVMRIRADAVDHIEDDGKLSAAPSPTEILLTGHELRRLEKGETVSRGDISLRVDHTSVQDYPVGDRPSTL